MSDSIVCKFGGSSVATADQIRRVEDIVNADERRRYVVVSAPGKSPGQENKITDLLYNLYFKTHPEIDSSRYDYKRTSGNSNQDYDELMSVYRTISTNLGLDGRLVSDFSSELDESIQDGSHVPDLVVSRGENFNARLIAEYLGADFVDSIKLISIPEKSLDGDNPETHDSIEENLVYSGNKIIIPGFYGKNEIGKVRTFARGGSDLTGALIAAGVNADVYENWTDTNGILCCDPSMLDIPIEEVPVIGRMSFDETRELTYMGFKVLNDETIGPLRKRNIPINLRNTNNPINSGTWISQDHDDNNPVRGIAGKDGFCKLNISKYLMNKQVGFGYAVLEALKENDVSYEHIPSGIDNMSLLIEKSKLNGLEEKLIQDITRKVNPDKIDIENNFALLAVVGEGMRHKTGMASRATTALARNDVNIEIMNQGSSEINMMFGVNSDYLRKAIQALYNEFIGG